LINIYILKNIIAEEKHYPNVYNNRTNFFTFYCKKKKKINILYYKQLQDEIIIGAT